MLLVDGFCSDGCPMAYHNLLLSYMWMTSASPLGSNSSPTCLINMQPTTAAFCKDMTIDMASPTPPATPPVFPGGRGRSCQLLHSLGTLPTHAVQCDSVVDTGLTWSQVCQLRCSYGRACALCTAIKADHSPKRKLHLNPDKPYDRAVAFLSKARLLLRFTARTDLHSYPCLMLSTAMKSPDSVNVDEAHPKLEIVGHFQTPGLRHGLQAVARRLIPAQFDPVTLKNWLSECEHHHGHQEARHDAANPSVAALAVQGRLRLIDVSTRALVSVATPERYAALSYVWGKATQNISIPESAYDMSKGPRPKGHIIKQWEALPQTIRDAARVTGSIGERYLWVDALCINQRDPEDRQRLVAEMGTIYGAAQFTIVATGDDADSGLPGVSFDSRNAETCIDGSIGAQAVQLVSRLATMDQALKKSKWSTRGWTFQELVLSRRAVVFAPEQTYFTCAKGEQAEGYPEGGLFSDMYQRDHIHRQRSSSDLVHNTPHQMIAEYSRRHLTHVEDRFNAFMGAATIQQGGTVSSEMCVALRGLPLQNFWEFLQWDVSPTRQQSSVDGQGCTRIESNLDGSLALPSWSWTGWTGDVTYNWNHWRISSKRRFEAVLMDEANIVLKSIAGAEEFPFWEPWPFEPMPYASKVPHAVTLHMWAPCVECYFVPMATKSYDRFSLPADQVVCAILLVSPDLTPDVLDALAGRPEDEFYWRRDNIGTITRHRTLHDSEAQVHRRVHRMVIFPRDRKTPSLILLEENPRDPDTVCRAAKVDSLARGMDMKPGDWYEQMLQLPALQDSGLEMGIWRHARHRYIRMQ